MAKLKYTDHQHLLLRALVLLSNMIDSDGATLLEHDSIREVVGLDVPEGTFKMVHKDAHNALIGKMTFDQYFKRTSQSKRKESK